MVLSLLFATLARKVAASAYNLRGAETQSPSKGPSEAQFEAMFSVQVPTIAAVTCRNKLQAASANDSCACVGGGFSYSCCMDGGINSSAAGGRNYDNTTAWRWLARPGFNWRCSEK